MNKILGWFRRNRVLQRILILLGMAIAVYLILPQLVELETSWQALTTLVPWLVGLAAIAQALSYVGSGFLLQSILALAHRRESLWFNTLIVFGSSSIGLVTGGMIGAAVAIRRWTNKGQSSMADASLASLALNVFNTLVLLLFAVFGMAHMVVTNSLTQPETIGFAVTLVVLILVIGGAALAVRFRRRATTIYLWISCHLTRLRRKTYDPRVAQRKAGRLFNTWDSMWHGAWQRPALGAFLNVACDMVTLYLLFLAAGEHVSLGLLLAGYGLPLLVAKVAFFIPGGVGVVEGGMAALYHVLGIPLATVAAVVLGYRLLSFWLPSLAGFPIAAYLQRSQHRQEKLAASKPVL